MSDDTRPTVPAYTKAEAARILTLSPSGIDHLLLKGRLRPVYTRGGQELVSDDELLAEELARRHPGL